MDQRWPTTYGSPSAENPVMLRVHLVQHGMRSLLLLHPPVPLVVVCLHLHLEEHNLLLGQVHGLGVHASRQSDGPGRLLLLF